VRDRQVVAALALQWETPVLVFPEETAPPSAIPWELLEALRIMPVRLSPTQAHLYVAFSDPAEHGVLPAIDQMFPRNSVQQQPLVAAESVRQALR